MQDGCIFFNIESLDVEMNTEEPLRVHEVRQTMVMLAGPIQINTSKQTAMYERIKINMSLPFFHLTLYFFHSICIIILFLCQKSTTLLFRPAIETLPGLIVCSRDNCFVR